jgi:carbon-monoxide dehydrogenase medium subunit/6-hydroxypseudooxynicotine dehydrogenase subunit alpha
LKPPPFAYVRATSPEEACTVLAEGGDDARVIAGGQSLVPMLSFRFALPNVLVDVNQLRELDFVDVGAGLSLGALCRHARLERTAALEGPWRAVREAAASIGHHPIRVRGTLGGSIAHADPAAELPVVSLALDAEIRVLAPGGRRTIPADEFFRGPYTTALQPAELITELRFAPPPPGAGTVFEEFCVVTGGFALASVCAGVAVADGRCTWARIALGGVGATPVRATAAEARLVAEPVRPRSADEAAVLAAEMCAPVGDAHASAVYRTELVRELTFRALRRLGLP